MFGGQMLPTDLSPLPAFGVWSHNQFWTGWLCSRWPGSV